jgi:hypothetical protein
MIVSEARLFTYGLAMGAGLMFVLDPQRGAARRAVMRDKSRRALRDIEEAAEVGSRDMTHRLEGAVARAKLARRREGDVSDEVLVSRVRARLGHVCSHPHAIDVIAESGAVTLEGPILAREAEPVRAAIARVRGVRVLEDRLERHAHADLPALQGAPVKHSELARSWTPAVRLALGVGAGAVALTSLVRGSPIGLVVGGASVLFLARSSTRGTPELFARSRHARREPPDLEAAPRVDGTRGEARAHASSASPA